MGWSLGWKVNEWARLREGNHSLMLLDNQLRLVETVEINYSGGSGVYANMFNATPFQIDGNFGITAGIAEMLLQSQEEYIHLLPALPDAWNVGSVKGLMARKNVEVMLVWNNNNLVKTQLISNVDNTIKVRYKDKFQTFILKAGEKKGCCKTSLVS